MPVRKKAQDEVIGGTIHLDGNCSSAAAKRCRTRRCHASSPWWKRHREKGADCPDCGPDLTGVRACCHEHCTDCRRHPLGRSPQVMRHWPYRSLSVFWSLPVRVHWGWPHRTAIYGRQRQGGTAWGIFMKSGKLCVNAGEVDTVLFDKNRNAHSRKTASG